MTVVPSVDVGAQIAAGTFYAAIDTVIYGRRYAQGEMVDTSAWSRRQVLQYLSLGLIVAPPVDGDGLPAYLLPVTILDADSSASTATVLMPSGQTIREVTVVGMVPGAGATATLVTTSTDRWVIGAGIGDDLVVNTLTAAGVTVSGDSVVAGRLQLPGGAYPGYLAMATDTDGSVTWADPAEVMGGGRVLISPTEPDTSVLVAGTTWLNPDLNASQPQVFGWYMHASASRQSQNLPVIGNGALNYVVGEWGGFSFYVPGPGTMITTANVRVSPTANTSPYKVMLAGVADDNMVQTASSQVWVDSGPGPAPIFSMVEVSGPATLTYRWRAGIYTGATFAVIFSQFNAVQFDWRPNVHCAYAVE